MAKKKKTAPSPDGRGFDRWTSNGHGVKVGAPVSDKQRKAVEDINKEMAARLKKKDK